MLIVAVWLRAAPPRVLLSQHASQTIAQALRLYSPHEIYVSLNGGKDSRLVAAASSLRPTSSIQSNPPAISSNRPHARAPPRISLHPPSVILHLVAAVLCGAQGGASAFDLSADQPFPVLVVNFDSHDAFPEETEFFGALCRRCKLQVRQLTKTCASHGALLQLLTPPPPFFSGHCRWSRHEV